MAESSETAATGGGRNVQLFACSGRRTTAEMADRACRELAREGRGTMACLTALAAGRQAAVQAARAADLNVVVNGCENACATKIFEDHEVRNYVQIQVTDLDVEVGEGQPPAAEQVAVVVTKIDEAVRNW
jgi:uncharacterized metal-binding protein